VPHLLTDISDRRSGGKQERSERVAQVMEPAVPGHRFGQVRGKAGLSTALNVLLLPTAAEGDPGHHVASGPKLSHQVQAAGVGQPQIAEQTISQLRADGHRSWRARAVLGNVEGEAATGRQIALRG